MGRDDIPADGVDDLLGLIQNHIDNKVNRTAGKSVLQVLPEGIAFQLAGARIGSDHAGVVGLDRRPCGDSRHDSLCSAGISGEIVVFDVAQTDTAVRLCHRTADVYGGAAGRGAHMNEIKFRGIDTAHLAVDGFPDEMELFFLCLCPVAAEGKYDGYRFRFNPGRIHAFQQLWENDVRGHGACDIACYNDNSFLSFYNLLQGTCSDRMGE